MSDDRKLPTSCPGENWCPVTATASLVGKKWHPVIIARLLADGPLGFSELESAVDGISSKVLSESLDDLGEKQLVDRDVINEKPVRVQYSLTEHGSSLEPVIAALGEWGHEHLRPVEEETASVV